MRLIDVFKDFFSIDTVNLDWNFFDLGVTSIELMAFADTLTDALSIEVNVLLFYEYPTLQAMIDYLDTL